VTWSVTWFLTFFCSQFVKDLIADLLDLSQHVEIDLAGDRLFSKKVVEL